MPMRRYTAARDLVERKKHEQVERDEDAVDAGHQQEEKGVELLAPLLSPSTRPTPPRR